MGHSIMNRHEHFGPEYLTFFKVNIKVKTFLIPVLRHKCILIRIRRAHRIQFEYFYIIHFDYFISYAHEARLSRF